MDPGAVSDEIVARLVGIADPVRAQGEARYLRSTRVHLGVRVPDVRRTVRAVAREHGVAGREDVRAVATALWPVGAGRAAPGDAAPGTAAPGDAAPGDAALGGMALGGMALGGAASGGVALGGAASGSAASGSTASGTAASGGAESEVHERCLAAVELLVAHAGVLDARDLDAIEAMLRAARTWALVDPLAEKAAGGIVERDPGAAAVLDRWASDPDFWIRRSALLALMPPLKDGAGDWDRFRRHADSMLDEKEFFVRKAIGWVLRETGKRRPELVAAWLDGHGDRVPGLVRREAVKYLG